MLFLLLFVRVCACVLMLCSALLISEACVAWILWLKRGSCSHYRGFLMFFVCCVLVIYFSFPLSPLLLLFLFFSFTQSVTGIRDHG